MPNIDTILFRVFGRHYSMLQVPEHLYHFSPAILRALIAETGFEVYRILYSPGIDGIALSIKNWWLSIRGASTGKMGKCSSPASAPGDTDLGIVTRLKRRWALPMLKPVGRLLAVAGHGDVFSLFARKM